MRQFVVTWVIDIDAETPREAAEEAFEIMQREGTTANVFTVVDRITSQDYVIDLDGDESDDA